MKSASDSDLGDVEINKPGEKPVSGKDTERDRLIRMEYGK